MDKDLQKWKKCRPLLLLLATAASVCCLSSVWALWHSLLWSCLYLLSLRTAGCLGAGGLLVSAAAFWQGHCPPRLAHSLVPTPRPLWPPGAGIICLLCRRGARGGGGRQSPLPRCLAPQAGSPDGPLSSTVCGPACSHDGLDTCVPLSHVASRVARTARRLLALLQPGIPCSPQDGGPLSGLV